MDFTYSYFFLRSFFRPVLTKLSIGAGFSFGFYIVLLSASTIATTRGSSDSVFAVRSANFCSNYLEINVSPADQELWEGYACLLRWREIKQRDANGCSHGFFAILLLPGVQKGTYWTLIGQKPGFPGLCTVVVILLNLYLYCFHPAK